MTSCPVCAQAHEELTQTPLLTSGALQTNGEVRKVQAKHHGRGTPPGPEVLVLAGGEGVGEAGPQPRSPALAGTRVTYELESPIDRSQGRGAIGVCVWGREFSFVYSFIHPLVCSTQLLSTCCVRVFY